MGENKFPVICLEGLPRVGKTTLLNHFSNTYNRVREYFDFIDVKNFSDNISTIEDLRRNQKLFLDIEEQRISQLVDGVNLVERSVLSNLAFSYALSSCAGIDSLYKESARMHLERLKDGKILLPTHYLFLGSENLDNSIAKVPTLEGTINMNWKENSFVEKIGNFYESYFEDYATAERIKFPSFANQNEVGEAINRISSEGKYDSDRGIRNMLESHVNG